MRSSRTIAAWTCAICERTLLVGERTTRFAPEGEDFLDVCPLCQEIGITVLLAAELDRDTLTVADVEGACVHAEAFRGERDLLTVEQQWPLTRAALQTLAAGAAGGNDEPDRCAGSAAVPSGQEPTSISGRRKKLRRPSSLYPFTDSC